MDKVIHYELPKGDYASWQFTFKYGKETNFLEIPMDMRGYYARYKEQYDWLKLAYKSLGIADQLKEAWSSSWEGELEVLQKIELWLQKEGAKVLPFS